MLKGNGRCTINFMNTSTHTRNPKWWTAENDSSWSHVKEAMRRDWDQTKHDFGGNQPNLNQNIGNTMRQAAGTETIPAPGEPSYDQVEPAYRYGYAARSQYGKQYADWDDAEAILKKEWEELEPTHRQTWMQDRAAIRYGWEFEP
jgi:hypothetical protein